MMTVRWVPGKTGAYVREGDGTGRLRDLDTLHMLTTEPPPLDWLADGVFARGALTLFGGREKRGKSLVALALAAKIAGQGGDVAGIACKPGNVLIVDAENGQREIHRRLRAIGLEPKYAAHLHIAEARGFELREDLELVADLADRHSADLVLLDSFRSLWRGKERDDDEVMTALDPLRAFGHDTDRSVGLIHHAQKSGEEYRGSTAIGAAIDWCVMIDRQRGDPVKARRRLSNPLPRIGVEREDRWLTICSLGDDGPVWLDAAEPYVPEQNSPVRDELEAAIRAHIEGVWGVASTSTDHTTPPPSWSQADLARAAQRDPKDWTVRQVIKRLAEVGYIHRNGTGRWYRTDPLFDDASILP
jgi:hypothetical protein